MQGTITSFENELMKKARAVVIEVLNTVSNASSTAVRSQTNAQGVCGDRKTLLRCTSWARAIPKKIRACSSEINLNPTSCIVHPYRQHTTVRQSQGSFYNWSEPKQRSAGVVRYLPPIVATSACRGTAFSLCSHALKITNMSSAPIPIAMNSTRNCMALK